MGKSGTRCDGCFERMKPVADLAGARWGVDSIPVSWVVEGYASMVRLGAQLSDERGSSDG